MKTRLFAVLAAVALVLTAYTIAQGQAQTQSPLDSKLDKIIEQNEKILKNQEEFAKDIKEMKEGLLQVRRRSS